ncbi:MAG: winged helix-turn-helix transcriptional regulator [Elusimicrobia bacterium]|nr:winged helix-turn-helix transcriptional regulator [Elusimicrobiota bacterium]
MAPKNLTDKLVFKIKSDFLRSLAHPVRLEIIEFLRQGESSVGHMVQEFGVEQSAISKHLAILRQAGLVSSRHEKVTVYYSIRDKEIFRVLRPIAHILSKRLQDSRAVLDRLSKA